MKTSERFRKAYDYLENKGFIHKKAQLAKLMGYSRSVVSNAYNGNDDFCSTGFLQKFCEVFPNIFNYEWLLNGTGDMLSATQKAQDEAKPTQVDKSFVDIISSLVEQNKELIRDNKEALAEMKRRHEEDQRTINLLLKELAEIRSTMQLMPSALIAHPYSANPNIRVNSLNDPLTKV